LLFAAAGVRFLLPIFLSTEIVRIQDADAFAGAMEHSVLAIICLTISLFQRGRKASWRSMQPAFAVLVLALLVTTIAHAQDAITQHFQAGRQAIQNGKLELAVTEFKEVLRLDPDLLEARVNLGLAQHLLGKYADSIATLAPAARENPDLVPAQIFLGIGYLKLGQRRKALPPLEQALRVDPANREAHRALASCRLEDADYRNATAEFRALFALEPDKGEAWYRLGRDYTDAASRLVRRMSLEHRRTAWGHRMAADLYSLSGRWEIAGEEFGEAIAVDPKLPGVHIGLGTVYLHQGKQEEALKEFHLAHELDPHDPQARLALAGVSLTKEDAAAAWEQVEILRVASPEILLDDSGFTELAPSPDAVPRLIQAVAALPTGPSSHFLLRTLFRLAGDGGKVRQEDAAVRAAVKTNPPESATRLDIDGYLKLGRAHFALRQWDQAAAAFASALTLVPNRPEVLYYLARCYQFLADECFRRMEEIAPESWRMHQVRAEVYAVRYNDAQAIAEYERAVQLRPDAAELYEELGALYQQNSRPDDARMALEKALSLDPVRPRTLYLLGQLLANEEGKGIPYLEKALSYDANLLEAHAMLGRAYVNGGKPAAAIHELQKALSLDRHGDLHYLLYRAYKDLGKTELARAALVKSAELRKNSVERDRDKLERWMKQ
jgi:tetratricopeptide (TPR) repeat protein